MTLGSAPIGPVTRSDLRRVAAPAPADIGSDRLVVWLVKLLFIALLLEGIARKWLFPAQQALFYFLRDPLVMVLYITVLLRGLPSRGWFAVWLAASLFLALISLAVYLSDGKPLLVWALGVRNYFEYVLLAFVVGRHFRSDDVLAFSRLVAALAPAVAVVALLQFLSPPGAWINLGAGGLPPPLFAGDILRTTGLMASDAQHVPYVLFTLAISASGFLAGSSRRSSALFLTGVVACIVMMIVSGSRAIWMLGAATFAAVLGAALLGRAGIAERARAVLAGLLMAALVAMLFTTALVRAWQAYEERNRGALTFTDVTLERITSMFLPGWMFEATLEGEGIGFAMTGAAAIMTGERALTLAESDWDRNFVELGALGGWLFVGLRVAFSVWLGWIGLRAARAGDPRAFVLASVAAPAILITQITMHTVYGHLAWMAAGLTIAAARGATGEESRRAGHASVARGAARRERASQRLAALRMQQRLHPAAAFRR